MEQAYKTIRQEGRDEFTLSLSRFISRSKPVSTEEEALAFLEIVRKAHRDASHNVWAYVLDGGLCRYSDDGEPRGTAGVPVLEVIRKACLRDVVLVVTRYFGGVKLGAGGLLRAYTRSANLALQAGGVIERRPYLAFRVEAGYAFAEKLQREYARRGYILKNTDYADIMTLTVLIPPEAQEDLRGLTAECTAGRGLLAAAGEEFLDFG